MKHTIIIALLVIFAGCKKEEMKGRLTFYNDQFTGAARLYVDGDNMGSFQASVEVPSCGEASDTRYITVEKMYGDHQYFVKDGSNTYPVVTIPVNSPCSVIKVEKP